MAELVFAHDALLPQRPGGQGAGAALALLVHAGLVAALTLSVDWRAHAPEVFSAELWASVPQPAAPPAPPPPAAAPEPPAPPTRTQAPPEPDADIAIERARELKRKQQAEEHKKEEDARKLAVVEKKKQDEADKKKQAAELKKASELKKAEAARREAEQQAREAKAEDERLALLREENLRRMMGQVGGSGGATASGTTAQSAGPSAGYANKVIARVRPHIIFNGTVAGNQAAEVEVTAAPGGSIISWKVVKKSGNDGWDEAVLRALEKTGSLPRDIDGRVPQTIIIAFRRE